MGIQKGDVIDESTKSLESCRLAIKVLEGGAGFSHLDCCGLRLTEADKSDSANESIERFEGDTTKTGVLIDESKNYPNSCGLKIEVIGGGGGLTSITCCGNELTVDKDAI